MEATKQLRFTNPMISYVEEFLNHWNVRWTTHHPLPQKQLGINPYIYSHNIESGDVLWWDIILI